MGSLGSIYAPSGGSSITTLPQYLTSIGKDSWYAQFLAGTEMYVNNNKTGGPVSLNNTVESWAPNPANTSNFTAYWTQAGGAAAAPYYAASNGVNSLVGTGNDGGGSRYMDLSSTTALNGAYTVICRHPFLARDGRSPYSHQATTVYWTTGSGSTQLFGVIAAGGTTSPDQIIHVVRNTPATSGGNAIFGLSATGTGHNNNAPRLFRRSANYSATSISELWFIPLLTAIELDGAMAFIT